MTYAYQTITINSTSFPVYADGATAKAYFGVRLGGSAWVADDPKDLLRALLAATSALDLMDWQGERTDEDQALAWPRTSVEIVDGTATIGVADDSIPTRIVTAAMELALALLQDPTLADSATGPTSSNVKALDAKGVSLEFFAPVRGPSLPARANALVTPYLAGATPDGNTGARSYSSGVDCASSFDSVADAMGFWREP